MKHPPGSDSDSTASEPARDSNESSGDSASRDSTSRDSTSGGSRQRSSRRRVQIDADSPFADAADIFAASDLAQLSALDVTAELFFNETVENLHLINPNPDSPYAHATIAETVRRFERAKTRNGPNRSEESSGKSQLPPFPRFRMDQTFYGWVHELSQAEDIAEFTTILGTTTAKAYFQITSAMTLIHGLPKFYRRCQAGDFTIEHVNATASACRDVTFKNLPLIDDYLAERRPDITIETFKKSLGMKVAVLEPLEDRIEEASKRRRVDITTAPNGTAYLTLTGPAPELQACYLRIAAFARALHSGNIAPFADQVEPGSAIDDDRGIDALMFDILTRTCPQVSIQVTSNNTTTGETTTREIPLEVPDDDCMTPGAVVDAVDEAAAKARSSCVDDEAASVNLVLVMPTHGQWFDAQARMVATVPFLTLTGAAELPGTFSDGSPIPAETARRIAGHAKSWTRILTDPATGTPIDAKATTYQIPASVRQTLVAKWQTCTIPGCSRRGENSEIDHIIPFDHDHPEQGGLTRFGNLHPLCKKHHQAKTDRRYSVRMTSHGLIEYVFRHGITTQISAAEHPINAAHAKLFDELRSLSPPPDEPTSVEPKQGEIRISEKPPGPEPSDEHPGWVKKEPLMPPQDGGDEWVWDAGGPPPF